MYKSEPEPFWSEYNITQPPHFTPLENPTVIATTLLLFSGHLSLLVLYLSLWLLHAAWYIEQLTPHTIEL